MYFKYVFQLLVFQLLHNTARDNKTCCICVFIDGIMQQIIK